MTDDEDEFPVVGYDPDEMREWMTTGAGAELAGKPESGDAPVDLLPAPGTPVSVLRNLRLPYEVDVALKAAAQARGITVSELIRESINAMLAGEVDTTPDPVVALRLTLAAAGRAVDRLAAEHPEAACSLPPSPVPGSCRGCRTGPPRPPLTPPGLRQPVLLVAEVCDDA